jgi:hypothetical protein
VLYSEGSYLHYLLNLDKPLLRATDERRCLFCNIKRKDVETVEDLEKDVMNISFGDRLGFLYYET